ncbi:matrixin family metalloprotease [Nocardioides guangzhouensis]|uniref:Matrixin family metalloprotease n=2 Tax=Nocardioides guangzhouensis TaxID=2497878 RepID=A0A4Q4ZBW2_9ACTN|nr:matrixin family metalloprotease [Nocardioides guangzhouensis]
MAHQPGSRDPVAYDPCEVIRVEVNPDGAPAGYRELVDTAVDHVSEPTGLRFAVVGETDRRPHSDNRRTALPGGGWPPVLVSWADSDHVPGLAGDVAGLGGSTSIEELGRRRYVTGEITLDRGAFQHISGRPDSRAQMQAILDHEFGHLIGLTHVHDRGELMSDDNVGRTTWGPGDLAGLSRLGRGRCG